MIREGVRASALHIPAFVLILALALAGGCRGKRSGEPETGTAGGAPSRIVSLSPSVTETLFTLGLGDHVAGVTRFCTYPPEAMRKPDIGGFLDPNYEAVVRLKPDLVVLLASQEDARRRLESLGIRTLVVRNEPVGEIFRTIGVIGKACGAGRAADSLSASLRARMNAAGERAARLSKPRVLLSAGRTAGTGKPGAVYAAGPGTYYDELISLAGGTNVCRGLPVKYPELSAEGIIRLDPEIIIDLVPDPSGRGLDEHAIKRDWDALDTVSAVKTGRVHVLTEDWTTVPGPRFILLLEDLARIIHPEAR